MDDDTERSGTGQLMEAALTRENLRLALTSTLRTAGCGPACPVVWEERGGTTAAPYPDSSAWRTLAGPNKQCSVPDL